MEYRGRRTRRADGHARRQAILEAALRIIVRDGIRAVRHRAVAAEAQVPLAATTYYFKDLGDLISDALTLHAERSLADTKGLEAQSFEALAAALPELMRDQTREKLADTVTELIMGHLRQQVAARDARIIEHAFRHEALRNDKLAADVQVPERAHLETIARFFTQTGSKHAQADAHLVLATLLHWEYHLTVSTPDGAAWQLAEQSLRRLMKALLLLECRN